MGAVDALLGASGGILSSIGSFASAAANRKFQREENQKDRDFNAQQAALSRQYNTTMVNAQNAYNNPSAIMARLSDAGINPALAYSGGAGSSVLGSVGIGSTSQTASHSGGYSGAMPDLSGLSQAGLMAAQANKANAEADNLREETIYQQIQNKYADLKARGEANYANVQVSLGNSIIAKNEKDCESIAQSMVESGERIKQMQALTDLTKVQIDDAKLAYKEHLETFDDRVNSMHEKFKITKAQAENINRQIDAAIAKMLSDVGVNVATTSNLQKQNLCLYWESGSKALKFKFDKATFDSSVGLMNAQNDAKAATALASEIIDLTGDAVGTIYDAINIKNAFKPRKEKDPKK